MIEIQQWLLHLSIACILVSVLSGFIQNEKANISIKSVLVLYILVITLNSVLSTNIKFDKEILDNSFEISSAINSNDLVIKNAQQNVCNELNKKFAEANIQTICKAVTLNTDATNVNSINLTNSNEEAIKIVTGLFGDKITVIIEKEG